MALIGKVQENTPCSKTERRRNPKTDRHYRWIVRCSAMANNYYIYAVDRGFGPLFLKFCNHFPFNTTVCLNGREYTRRQLAREGIAFEADNGILGAPNLSVCSPFCGSVCRQDRRLAA